MVIRGNSRGNAKQLASYLLDKRDNEDIRILDVDGQFDADSTALHRAVFAMGISAELSKGDKGLYHAQINPDIEASGTMTDDHWLQASDILAKQLGLENQRRVIVLHSKKLRTHAHVVWERFDHEKGKLVSDSFSRLAQDRARKEMEEVLEHKPTPHRNKHRPELKASLTKLWEETENGQDFIEQARKQKYIIGAGSGRAPFIVVDENARSYDLTRQLKGVRIKEVRARLRHEPLIGEKEAIILAREAASDTNDGSNGTRKTELTPKPDTMNDKEKAYGESLKDQFAQNQTDTNKASRSQSELSKQFAQNRDEIQPSQAVNPRIERLQQQQEALQKIREQQQEESQQKASTFQQNRNDMSAPQQKASKPDNGAVQEKAQQEKAAQEKAAADKAKSIQDDKKLDFKDNRRDVTKSDADKNVQKQFKENKPPQENTGKKDESEKERERQRVRAKLQKMQEEIDRQRGKNKGFDMG